MCNLKLHVMEILINLMERNELTTILLSLPVNVKMKAIPVFNSSNRALQLLELQGYIHLEEEREAGICQASLTNLGIEWVKHHVLMIHKRNIIL